MSATCFETEGSSSGRRLYKQVRYSVLNMHEIEQCVPYTLFFLQRCLQIVMNMIYRNNRSVCVCVFVCVCVCGLRTVCDVTNQNVWQRTVHLIPAAGHMFWPVQLLVLLLTFFPCSYSISPPFFLRAPFYDHSPRPTPLPLPCAMLSAVTFHPVW
jgi:hypothetical protein